VVVVVALPLVAAGVAVDSAEVAAEERPLAGVVVSAAAVLPSAVVVSAVAAVTLRARWVRKPAVLSSAAAVL
jgi:hypothetical protein